MYPTLERSSSKLLPTYSTPYTSERQLIYSSKMKTISVFALPFLQVKSKRLYIHLAYQWRALS